MAHKRFRQSSLAIERRNKMNAQYRDWSADQYARKLRQRRMRAFLRSIGLFLAGAAGGFALGMVIYFSILFHITQSFASLFNA